MAEIYLAASALVSWLQILAHTFIFYYQVKWLL